MILKNLENNYKKILTCFSPIIPHFTNECLYELGVIENSVWPVHHENLLEEELINIVVQINGKKRGLLRVKKDIEERTLLEILKKDKSMEKYINNTEIKKIIFVQNRLINILIND